MKIRYCSLFLTFLFWTFIFAQPLLPKEGQVYVCPLAEKIEEINPRCACRIDLELEKTTKFFCDLNGQFYELTLTITEYEGNQYYVIFGFENGGAGVNFPPVAKILESFEGKVEEPIFFSAKDSYDLNDDPLDFEWDFGDGNFGKGKEIVHVFSKPGKYILKLTVSDGMALSVATASIFINEKFEKAFSSFPQSKIKTKEEKEIVSTEIKEKIGRSESKFLISKNSKEKVTKEKEKESEKEIFRETTQESLEKERKSQKRVQSFFASLFLALKEKNLFFLLFAGIFIFAILFLLGFGFKKRAFKGRKI